MKNRYYNFSQFITLEQQQAHNPQILWNQPVKYQNKEETSPKQWKINKKPKLLESAITHIRLNRQKHESDAISDLESIYSSNFIFSRENTPVTYTHKKKNKHKTINSELFDIQSQNELKKDENEAFQGLILIPHHIGLPELIFEQAVGKNWKVNPKIINNWKDCLSYEDKTEIYGDNAQYSQSRIFPINQLEKGFNQIYGTGKKRCLYIGQYSIISSEMQRYLDRCLLEPNKIARKSFDILSDILAIAKLSDLQSLQVCMKQIELLWKVLATFWRYSGKLDLQNNKRLQNAIINGWTNFVDLKKDSPITQFLFSQSNIQEIVNN